MTAQTGAFIYTACKYIYPAQFETSFVHMYYRYTRKYKRETLTIEGVIIYEISKPDMLTRIPYKFLHNECGILKDNTYVC